MSIESWADQYVATRHRYQSFATRLHGLIDDLLRMSAVDVVQIENRTKEIDSFSEKIRRKKYADPFSQMTDIIGLRIVTYYTEDVDRVEEIIRSQFSIDETNSADKSVILDPDQFGYRSRHFVATLGGDRRSLPEWQSYVDICFEIQVRTALQHAWAAVHHKLDYKRVNEVPQQLRRGLYRLSALFEIADEQVSALRDSVSRVEEGYSSQLTSGNLDIGIDMDSLRAYFSDSERRGRLEQLASQVPWGIIRDENLESRDRRYLIELCSTLGWSKIADIDQAVTIADDRLVALLKSVRENYIAVADWQEDGTLEDFVEAIIMATNTEEAKPYIQSVYKSEVYSALVDAQSRYNAGK